MSKYVLYVDTYSFDPDYVDPGDSLSYHSGAKFSTKDRDHDTNSGSCSSVYLVILALFYYVAKKRD